MADLLLKAALDASNREDWPATWHLLNAELNDRPDRPEALFLMGHLLRVQGHIGMASHVFGKALAQQRDHPNLWMNYGATLHDLGRQEEAIKAFSVVAGMMPNDPMPPANIAASLSQLGRWNDTINAADRALSIQPDNHIAKIAKTFACLALGRWKDGWENADYLYGHHLNVRVYRPDTPEPAWDGSQGKTVVVTCDQGLGDQIMFSQCLPQMAEQCKQVIVECAPRMESFFRRNFPMVTVYPTLKMQSGVEWTANHDIDAHIHISHLGKFYRLRDSDFPRVPYIKPVESLVSKWRQWLEHYPRPWIGIAWRGGVQNTQKHLRSIDLEQLKPVLNQKATFVDMSYQDNSMEVARWNIDNENQIINPRMDKNEYEDTIALASVLDEVVTVTTSLVHVCGALGRTANVLTPEVAQWRYSYKYKGGKSMIWYSDSVKLFRQLPGEDWIMPITRVAKELK